MGVFAEVEAEVEVVGCLRLFAVGKAESDEAEVVGKADEAEVLRIVPGLGCLFAEMEADAIGRVFAEVVGKADADEAEVLG
jgi:hypothetical protein